MSLLRVDNLRGYYGKIAALHGVSFSMEKGSIVALLGPNGAGKTTVLRSICGMIPTAGTIEIMGRPVAGAATDEIVRMGVAHVPEGRGTFTHLTTEENLILGAITRKDRSRLNEDIEQVYTQFPRLKERRLQQAGTLSGGEQQMLAIGRALMLRPTILLLDEPSFGLAPLVVREIFETLRAINRSQGVAILLIEQNASLALSFANEVHVLETGRFTFSGAASSLRGDDGLRKAYLGA